MKKTSTANAIFALSLGLATWFSCQTNLLAAKADNQPINSFKGAEQKTIVKTDNHLQFDKTIRVHRCAQHSKQDLTLDQGF